MKEVERRARQGFDSPSVHQKRSPQVSDDNRSVDEKEFRMLLMGRPWYRLACNR